MIQHLRSFKLIPLLCMLCMLLMQPAWADALRMASPEKVGISSERLERLNALAESYVSEGKVPGMITMVARHGKLVHFEATGKKGLMDKRDLEKDDLFRIYSMTKPITAIAAMQLYEQGKFQLNDPISKWVPELKDLKVLNTDGSLEDAAGPVTMHHLLTHTAGFSYGFMPNDPVDQQYRDTKILQSKNLKTFVDTLATLPLKFHPGQSWNYSVAVDVTGLIVERISGQRFDKYLDKHIFKPLGMKDTFFSVPDDKLERFLPNHAFDRESGKVVPMGEDAIESYRNVEQFSGGGGLVSTAEDYMRFSEMLRNGGVYKGTRIIGPKTLDYMTTDHLSDNIRNVGTGESLQALNSFYKGQTFGLGFGIVSNAAQNKILGSNGEFYWGGAAGTVFWVDPVEDIVVIAMIQLMGSPWPLRSDLRVAIYQALEEIAE